MALAPESAQGRIEAERVRHARDDHLGLEPQDPLDVERATVVEQVTPPAGRGELGDDHTGQRPGCARAVKTNGTSTATSSFE
jgi:hypothetical protein